MILIEMKRPAIKLILNVSFFWDQITADTYRG
jgi:hypothetical protein